jgi:hypothetical protein
MTSARDLNDTRSCHDSGNCPEIDFANVRLLRLIRRKERVEHEDKRLVSCERMSCGFVGFLGGLVPCIRGLGMWGFDMLTDCDLRRLFQMM